MKKIPKVIIHNSVSIDGSLTGFQPNMELHYRIAGSYNPDANLIGSNTIIAGIELFGDGVPPEEKSDFEKPIRDKDLPYWVVIDTKERLKGLLHTCRRFEFCKDVIVLVSESTPKTYLEYLKERNYDYHVVGSNHIDLNKALLLLSEVYSIKKILTDTGRVLSNILLNNGFVDEISLLVHPVIVGNRPYSMFSDVKKDLQLKLIKKEVLDEKYIWLVYRFGD